MFTTERQTLLSTAKDDDQKFLEKTAPFQPMLFVLVTGPVDGDSNTQLLNASIDYTVSTMRLERSLFLSYRDFII